MLRIEQISERKWLRGIGVLSVVIVAAVAFLIYNAQGISTYNPKIYVLPKLNAFLNSSVFILLLAGFYFIKNQNIRYHRACMLAAFIFSSLFLVSYVAYHFSAPETYFGDTDHNGVLSDAEKAAVGGVRYFYLILLTTHIILSTIIVPLALVTLFRIFNLQVEHHKKIARITLPIWLYVSLTGVIVYMMISTYYPA